MKAEEEVEVLRVENKQLQELLAQALARIAELEARVRELEEAKTAPLLPSFVKPNTRAKEKSQKQPRRKRAKDQNGARRRETPTQTVEHKLEQCPDCAYPLRHPTLAKRRQ